MPRPTTALRLIFSLLVGASVLSGCVPPASKRSPPAGDQRVRVEDDRLRFSSIADALAILTELDAAAEFDRLGSPSACDRFEATLGFRSLRRTVQDGVERRLAHGWDGASSLDDDEFVAWTPLRAILNHHHQLQIGSEVLTLLDDETMLATPASNEVALRTLVSHPTSARAFAARASGDHLGRLLDRATGRPHAGRRMGSRSAENAEPAVVARAQAVLFDGGRRVLVGKLAHERFFGTRLVFEAQHYARSKGTASRFEPRAADELRVTLGTAGDSLAPRQEAGQKDVSLPHDARLELTVIAPLGARVATFQARSGGECAEVSLPIGGS